MGCSKNENIEMESKFSATWQASLGYKVLIVARDSIWECIITEFQALCHHSKYDS